ncbi:hypothetical protein ACVINH_004980 [Rhizobium anhuiense]
MTGVMRCVVNDLDMGKPYKADDDRAKAQGHSRLKNSGCGVRYDGRRDG